jgi:hypothetical protein
MDADLKKDPAILAVLARLQRDLGEATFEIADDWEADLSAIGIVSPRNPRVLAYLSTWQQPPDQYYLELELPAEGDDKSEYQVAGRWESISYSELRDRLAQHLARIGAR